MHKKLESDHQSNTDSDSHQDPQPHPPPSQKPDPPTRFIPPFLSKHVKLSEQGRRNMSDYENDRVCELDSKSNRRVLVYDTRRNESSDWKTDLERWNEMDWTQKRLAEAAKKDDKLRISRKEVNGMRLEIFQRDLFQGEELKAYSEYPNMVSSLASVKLGVFQAELHQYVYILSSKGH